MCAECGGGTSATAAFCIHCGADQRVSASAAPAVETTTAVVPPPPPPQAVATAVPPPPPPPPPAGVVAAQEDFITSLRNSDNKPAVWAFVLGMTTILGTALSMGTDSSAVGLVTFLTAIAAIFAGTTGKSRVDRGLSRQHRDLARAGMWIGVVLLVVIAVLMVYLLLLVHEVTSAFDATY